ncbi:transcriptional regulator (plasmid) [Azospirillum sp. B510]|uniref:MarR family winged helix-turn-helix transcriptional regulator n=1 Tax=Azospirillum sp. (strain B510) TaxID=137722 RepID=UPI0001C4C7B5|nr:MarR family winged helix-turn-helix transcriptional regulator [Azospirillum sp. B510]BAI75090.1 transcriptional regulator [Azospirillum sp. B510]
MAIAKKLRRYIPSDPAFNVEEFPFYWLARVQGVYSQRMEAALKRIGTDIPSWRVLFILKTRGTSSISELSTHAIVKLSTMTRIVYRMKAEGLVETGTNADDGRVTEVTMTPAGDALAERIQEATTKLFARSFEGLSEAQIARLNAILQQLYDNLAED